MLALCEETTVLCTIAISHQLALAKIKTTHVKPQEKTVANNAK